MENRCNQTACPVCGSRAPVPAPASPHPRPTTVPGTVLDQHPHLNRREHGQLYGYDMTMGARVQIEYAFKYEGSYRSAVLRLIKELADQLERYPDEN